MKRATSILIPSFKRPVALLRCLQSLEQQTNLPDEVIVVWQADDCATRDAAEKFKRQTTLPVVIAHSPVKGITVAENVALSCAWGEILLLIDDDATAPPPWLERHLAYFEDDTVGAVGGPADNYTPSNAPFPRREPKQIGRIMWYGRTIGNMYDYPNHWRRRPAIEVDHAVGYNLAIRRVAFGRFEERLRPYWQKFETELCLQVSRRGYRILFDFGNVVNHYPTNTVYAPGRSGDLEVKVYNAAFNWAFVLSKHSPGYLTVPRLVYLLLIGSSSTPGIFSVLTNALRGGSFLAEAVLLPTTLRNFVSGWSAGVKART